MAKINTRPTAAPVFTHEGAPAYPHLKPEQALRRSILSCLLFEDEFYEDGISIADRIMQNAAACNPEVVSALAIEARRVHGLRHAPLLLLLDLVRRGGSGVAATIASTIKRADDMTELLALYWKFNPGKGLSKQLKVGLARAFANFDEYQLAKYDREGIVRLRDVLFQSHAKPLNDEQAALFKRVADRALAIPDTWETELSAGADKKATFERLISENKLGYLALLRNLRNMVNAGVDLALVKNAILARKGGADLVFPFRYVAAARAVPQLEPTLDKALLAAMAQMPKLPGKTLVLVDVSGSMQSSLSSKSDLTRLDAAAALGAIARNVCEEPFVYATAGSDSRRKHATEAVPPREGMALIDAIKGQMYPLGGGGIFLNQAMRFVREKHPTVDRIIVVTDEQDCGVGEKDAPQNAPAYGSKGNYLINVASYKNGIGYPGTGWTHIDGFSEAVIRYIAGIETQQAA